MKRTRRTKRGWIEENPLSLRSIRLFRIDYWVEWNQFFQVETRFGFSARTFFLEKNLIFGDFHCSLVLLGWFVHFPRYLLRTKNVPSAIVSVALILEPLYFYVFYFNHFHFVRPFYDFDCFQFVKLRHFMVRNLAKNIFRK